MKIGILGSGLTGGKLGTLLARAGHEVVFSYSRSAGKLEQLARAAGEHARAGTPAEAVRDAGALMLAVHWLRIEDVLGQSGDLSGKVILSCTLPMNEDNTGLVIAQTTSGAEAFAQRVPGARLVGAFNTVPSEVLFHVFAARRRARKPSLIYYGDHRDWRGPQRGFAARPACARTGLGALKPQADAAPGAKKVAAGLIRDLGFDPLDAAPLNTARYAEPFALLVAQLAYDGPGSPELAYRFDRFGGQRAA